MRKGPYYSEDILVETTSTILAKSGRTSMKNTAVNTR